MADEAYALDFVLDGQVHTILWREDPSGRAEDFVCTRDGIVVTTSRSELGRVADSLGVTVVGDGSDSSVDLDAVAAWLASDAGDPDPLVTLAAWNLFGDVARSVGESFEDRSANLDQLYDKLFAGNNLPAVTPPGEHYVPLWCEAERAALRSILANGLLILRRGAALG